MGEKEPQATITSGVLDSSFMNSVRWCLGNVYSVSFMLGGEILGVVMDGME